MHRWWSAIDSGKCPTTWMKQFNYRICVLLSIACCDQLYLIVSCASEAIFVIPNSYRNKCMSYMWFLYSNIHGYCSVYCLDISRRVTLKFVPLYCRCQEVTEFVRIHRAVMICYHSGMAFNTLSIYWDVRHTVNNIFNMPINLKWDKPR